MLMLLLKMLPVGIWLNTLISQGYLFQPLAFKTLGPCSKARQGLCEGHWSKFGDGRSLFYLNQTFQCHTEAIIGGTLGREEGLEKIYSILVKLNIFLYFSKRRSS